MSKMPEIDLNVSAKVPAAGEVAAQSKYWLSWLVGYRINVSGDDQDHPSRIFASKVESVSEDLDKALQGHVPGDQSYSIPSGMTLH
jgi:hypothetical protein